jgi:hypothetical protein
MPLISQRHRRPSSRRSTGEHALRDEPIPAVCASVTPTICFAMSETSDWRLPGQEAHLQGATLARKNYRARDESWEHDHCEFCWAKFMDPTFSEDSAEFIADNPDVLTVGFGVQGRSPSGGTEDDYWWVCPQCVADFAQRFDCVLVDE